MKNIKFYLFIVVIFSISCVQVKASSPVTHSKDLETVTLRLKWFHQFQFAGYYAAIEKGYYQDAGLNVVLIEGQPGVSNVDEVVEGRADFGIDMPVILIERNNGKPIVVLAAIFQHSPEILITLKITGIASPHDLIGKKILMRPKGQAEIRAMFRSEGILEEQLKVIDHTWKINDLIEGKVDASGAYITDFPFLMQERGVPYSIISPLTYGIDFYGDCLFTTEKIIDQKPNQVRAFLAASLKGWDYAMNNPEEIIDLILKKYSARLSREALFYEATAMQELMQTKFIEIGHMNPGRWKHIADTFVKLKMLDPDYFLEGFLYDPSPKPDYTKLLMIVWILLSVVTIIVISVIILFVFNRKLNREVIERTEHLSTEISERNHAEKALKASESFLNSVIENIPNMIFIKDAKELKFVRFNKAGEELLGYSREHLIGKSDYDFFPKEEADFFTSLDREVLADKKLLDVPEEQIQTNEKGIRILHTRKIPILDENGTPLFLLGISEDITKIKKAIEEKTIIESKLRHSQKMEAIGTLAGGISHDFNNLLQAMTGYTQILLMNKNEDNPDYPKLIGLQKANERAAQLVKQLLLFSRKVETERLPLDLNQEVEQTRQIIERTIPKMIDVDVLLASGLWAVKADPVQMEQIILNLSNNAADAMSSGGKLSIETKNITLDDEFIEKHVGATAGKYVLLVVSDTGHGMNKEAIEHIFEPFYTTKDVGKGTGLGLASVYGIVKSHGGYIDCDSTLGQGTTFKVYLPAYEKAVAVQTEKLVSRLPKGGVETVLLVDDEEQIRDIASEMIQEFGYTVLTASSGEEALEIYEDSSNKIDIIILDIGMPGMGGYKCLIEILKFNDSAKVIIASGYSLDGQLKEALEAGAAGYVGKPYKMFDLLEKVRTVLDSTD